MPVCATGMPVHGAERRCAACLMAAAGQPIERPPH